MTAITCADILAGRAPADTPVTLEGWVRTRRDSKAGISFVHVSDGSCFHPCRWSRRTRCRTTRPRSCASPPAARSRPPATIVPSPAKGQPFEMQASAIDVDRLGRRSRHVSDPAEAAHARVPARGRAPAAAHQRHRRGDARAPYDRAVRSTASSTSTASSGSTRRSSRRPTPKARASCSACRRSTSRTCRARRDGKVDYAQDFFGRETFLTVSGQLNVETYCMALSKVYTFGPTFRAENSNTSRHLAEFWMIEPEIAFADLADDATLAEALLKHIFRTVLDERADDMAFFEERDRKGRDREAARHRRLGVRAHGLRRGDPRPRAVEAEVRVPGEVGHRPAIGARALSGREAREQAGDR